VEAPKVVVVMVVMVVVVVTSQPMPMTPMVVVVVVGVEGGVGVVLDHAMLIELEAELGVVEEVGAHAHKGLRGLRGPLHGVVQEGVGLCILAPGLTGLDVQEELHQVRAARVGRHLHDGVPVGVRGIEQLLDGGARGPRPVLELGGQGGALGEEGGGGGGGGQGGLALATLGHQAAREPRGGATPTALLVLLRPLLHLGHLQG